MDTHIYSHVAEELSWN